jgi:RimJ/RimL family protein N-acetyltransferase
MRRSCSGCYEPSFLENIGDKGVRTEAASAVIAYARDTLGLSRIVAIVSPDNAASIGLLERLGLSFEKCARLSETVPEVRLHAMDLGRL